MEAVQVAPEVRRGRALLATTVIIGHAIKHLYLSAMQSILLPEIKLGLGLSATQLGTLATSRQVTGWVTTMGAGYIGDRFINRAAFVLWLSLSLMGISYFLAGSAPSYPIMFLAMLLVGIGPSLYHPPAIGSLSRRFPDRRGLAISLHGMGGSIGEMLGPLTAAGALTFLMWRDVLKVSLFPALLGAFLVWGMFRMVPALSPEESATSSRAYFSSLWSLLKKRALLSLVGISALRSMGQSAVMIFLPVYLREDLEYSAARVAIYLSLAQVVGIGAQPAMGFISDRFGRKTVLVPAMVALGLLFFALRYAGTGAQLVLTILAMGAFLYSLHAIFISAAMDVAGEAVQSTTVSLMYGAAFVGTISPIFAGMVADAFGTTSAFLYAGAIVLAAALLLARVRLPRTAVQRARSS